ncbi:Rrf2 family transcriptional regulator [Nisaea acidiphila]|uniref:Rrf2 family transcriptional regulator n=1 Tax=Nisaea acidiphila TaxID=1862145 RepID=A0A9J7AYM6_9PROT|nr:Rrf2 family transcriptional regulator [Nisaea acidiphila]UUX51890.1 Rrf2 family transcriptional regulator [Nisaea acidiphila]
MRLNVQTDYALRLLMHLAVNPDRLITIREAADRFSVSKTHLMKLANAMSHEGFIQAVRGRSGGLRLARPAGEIRVGDVVRRMENDFAVVECFQAGRGECLITPACRLKGVLNRAVEAFLAELDACTLEDLVRANEPLRLMLA